MPWERLAAWWLDEVNDPAYAEVVTPLLLELVERVETGGVVADLGSGDGRMMSVVAEATGSRVVGVELVESLARRAASPVVVSRLPVIPFADASLRGAYAVLVLDHIEDHEALFAEIGRVVQPGGFLAVVSNHPVWTAPGSTPIEDSDGEILWRPGRYFDGGSSTEPAGGGEVVFFHRSMSDLLNAAADAGWSLERLMELSDQESVGSEVPRLMGVRWRNRSGTGNDPRVAVP